MFYYLNIKKLKISNRTKAMTFNLLNRPVTQLIKKIIKCHNN